MSISSMKPLSQMFSSSVQKRMMARERDARLELNTQINESNAQIARTEKMIADALDADIIDFNLIVSHLTNIDSIKSRLHKLEEIRLQIFPDYEKFLERNGE